MTPFRRHRLVVFDVDGTLYRQPPVRRAMVRALALDAASRFSLRRLLVVRDYRRRREVLADREHAFDEARLRRDTAEALGLDAGEVDRIVTNFIDTRPLPLLRPARVAGVQPLFAALRAAGVTVAALSDYPAAAKLEAMDLRADIVVAAAEAGAQKPDPRGLAMVLERAGVRPDEALMVGDRADRDGLAAERAGTAFLLRADGPAGPASVRDFTDPRLAALTAPPPPAPPTPAPAPAGRPVA